MKKYVNKKFLKQYMKHVGSNVDDPKQVELERIRASYKVYSLTKEQISWIEEALQSTEWDWYTECDGNTLVSEAGWETRYHPPAIVHDYLWIVGRGGWESNRRFYLLNVAYNMTIFRASIRWVGVTIGWYGFFKWWKKWKGNHTF